MKTIYFLLIVLILLVGIVGFVVAEIIDIGNDGEYEEANIRLEEGWNIFA